MDELTPLERFYFENASKEDLIAEVLQLRANLRNTKDLISSNSKINRQLEKLESENKAMKEWIEKTRIKLTRLNETVCRLKKRVGEKAVYIKADKAKVLQMKHDGLSISESAKILNVSDRTIARIRSMFNAEPARAKTEADIAKEERYTELASKLSRGEFMLETGLMRTSYYSYKRKALGGKRFDGEDLCKTD